MTYVGRRALVTGACGFIGSHLTEGLHALGASVTALCFYNRDLNYGWLDGRDDIDRVHGDIRDAEQMRKLVENHDIVFHLAALIDIPYSYQAPRSYVDTNVTGTLNVLEACRAHKARLVHTSTSEVYGTAQVTPQTEDHPINPQSPYAASKVAADALVSSYVRSFGLDAVTIRPFNTYGPRQSERAVIASLVRQARECDEIRVGDLTTRRDFNHVSDTVGAFLTVGESGKAGEVYNAGSGRSVTIGHVLEYLTVKPAVTDSNRIRPDASEVRELCADASKLRALGWKPKVDLWEGLAGLRDSRFPAHRPSRHQEPAPR